MYNTLVNRYYQHIFRYCCFRLNYDSQAAYDCTQEVFLALYRKLPSLPDDCNYSAWLYEAADREVKAFVRKYSHPCIPLEELPEEMLYESASFAKLKSSPLDALSHSERIFTEKYYSGCDKTEIAEQSGTSLNAVYLKMHRIKQKISDYINSKK